MSSGHPVKYPLESLRPLQDIPAKPPRICWVAKAFVKSHHRSSTGISIMHIVHVFPVVLRLSSSLPTNFSLPFLQAQLNTMVYVVHVLLVVTGDWSLSPFLCHGRRAIHSPRAYVINGVVSHHPHLPLSAPFLRWRWSGGGRHAPQPISVKSSLGCVRREVPGGHGIWIACESMSTYSWNLLQMSQNIWPAAITDQPSDLP
ncbi:hypothetical protein DFH08DRAFT_819969 [Mycena albidolilacea]|uniref:Uncharacterized protein n=1 Tax=Mycena albidolilacea TaxID=1033008 RepID=A0AAD6ZDQ5_9AGAR|nr:hypothetical protein DFH08DRAFT_819969 [Mycena albidolilacea]